MVMYAKILLKFTKKSKADAGPSVAMLSGAQQRQSIFLSVPGRVPLACNMHEAYITARPLLLIQDVGDTQQVFGRPDVNINLLCCPGIGMPKNSTDKLDGDTFSVQGCGEIMPQRMRPEPRYPGVPGKFFTEAVQTTS